MANRRVGMFGVEPNAPTESRTEDGVAALLRRRREELGRDVASVARQLRIRAVYIQAIEEGRLHDLPGTAYAVGFVRAYADYLGLDGNSIVSDYRDELSKHSRQNQLIWPVDQVEHKHFPGGIILVVSLIVAVVLYGGWYFASQPGGTGIDLIDRVPEFMKKQTSGSTEEDAVDPLEGTVITGNSSASLATAPSNSSTPTPASAQASQAETSQAEAPQTDATQTDASQTDTSQAGAAPSESGPADNMSSVENAVAASSPGDAILPVPPSEGAEGTGGNASAVTDAQSGQADAVQAPVPGTTAATPNVEAPAVPAATAATADAAQVASTQETIPAADDASQAGRRIVLRAAKDSWVEIFDASQNVVLQRILRAGETYAVPDQPGLVMNTGNAGGLIIEVDGRAQPSLGSVGVVKRGIMLEPGAFSQQ